MKRILLIAFLAFSTLLSLKAQEKPYAQDSTQKRTEAKIYMDGADSPKRIYIISYVWTPYEFQKSFRYIDADYYDELVAKDEKVKNKYYETAKSKDVSKLELYNGLTFEQATYADLTEVGLASIPQKYLLNKVVDGEMAIYVIYPSYTILSFDDDQLDYFQNAAADRMRENGDVLISMNGGTLKSVKNLKLQDVVADKSDIVTKLEAGVYDGLKKYTVLLKSAELSPMKDLGSFKQLANDYNN